MEKTSYQDLKKELEAEIIANNKALESIFYGGISDFLINPLHYSLYEKIYLGLILLLIYLMIKINLYQNPLSFVLILFFLAGFYYSRKRA